MDLLKAGFNVYLIKDAIGYVAHEGHVEALAEMEKSGIRLV
jgi:nicotinamidase-related amidase